MAPIPDPMPVATARRLSSGVRLSLRARIEPKLAEIWAVGPSRPPDPPEPMVRADARVLITVTRARTPFGCFCTASMAASVPCPSASGAKPNTRIPAARPPAATTSGIAHGREKSLACAGPPSPTVPAGV